MFKPLLVQMQFFSCDSHLLFLQVCYKALRLSDLQHRNPWYFPVCRLSSSCKLKVTRRYILKVWTYYRENYVDATCDPCHVTRPGS